MHDPDAEPQLVLNPSTRLLWRTPRQIQLELGTRRVIVDGVDHAAVRRLLASGVASGPSADGASADGGASDGGASAGGGAGAHGAAAEAGAEAGAAIPASALDALASSGFITRRRRQDRRTQLPRLATDLAALRVQHGDRAEDVFVGRRAAAVAVLGTSRAAVPVATLLAGAGVGHVAVSGAGDVRLHQTAPGGLQADDEGQRFTVAAAAALARAAPDCDVRPQPLHLRPDLVVVASDAPVDTDLRDTLHALGIAHLAVQAGADHGAVGPLVLPGVASCLRCADLQRLDRDHAWPALAVQLTIAPKYGTATAVGLASLVASVAALQALAFLDGDDPATIDATLEIQLPDWRLRRRSWAAHPDCGCGAHAAQRAGWAL